MSGTPFRASPGLALFVLCAHAAAGAAAWVSISGAAGAAIGLLATLAGGLAAHGRALLLAQDSPSILAFSAAGELRIVDRIGREWAPVAHAPRYVSRWLVILTAASAPAGRARRLLVTRDMLPPEAFRRLRIWALWGGAAQPASN